ncbi:unnamed protein product [Phytophthora fragariaefolia]|uniref:Unnamed protein product n=1 Tax=Phytophthora fragariaefolia TaxID=1490495 RepID=A0A9W7DAP8_9STRA|nr:unnamed protein product [Phytophthora fragariaefolia]
MAGIRRNYSDEEMEYAIQCAVSGEAKVAVAERTNIPYSTLCKWVKDVKDGEGRQLRRRGPAPLLPPEAEQSLFEWAVARQQTGVSVVRQEIISKACAMSDMMFERSVGGGWYRRFLSRYPLLTTRTAQNLSCVCNNVAYEDVWALFGMLTKITIQEALCSTHVFNVDETAFETHKRSKTLVATRGSKNVWTTESSTNFHLTIVACGSASGFAVPSVFIVPGKTVRLDVLNTCSVPGAAITTTESDFMNSTLFETWIQVFANSVPSPIRQLLVLAMDGCSSHYSLPIVQAANNMQVRLVCLPANATHLFQPLDVAVFGSFKAKMRALLNSFAADGGAVSLSKSMALQLLVWLGERATPTRRAHV